MLARTKRRRRDAKRTRRAPNSDSSAFLEPERRAKRGRRAPKTEKLHRWATLLGVRVALSTFVVSLETFVVSLGDVCLALETCCHELSDV